MNLATRCTTCGTIFRVVQDQLRVSEGWVRCGRCAEVFDAREQLFDLERDSPPPWPPLSAPAEPAPIARSPSAEPPYQSYQGQFQPSQPAPAYEPAPPPPLSPPSFSPPPTFAPEPPPPHEARDGWHADDNGLNPFAPPRRMADEAPTTADDPRHDEAGARFEASDLDGQAHEERREPFLDAPAAPDPRSHLPEPKGMRFEEDELPPPMVDDDRPDVTFALSPAMAAQLEANDPSMEPTTSMLATDEDALIESHLAAKTRKPRRSWNPFKRFRRAKTPSPHAAETTMAALAAESEMMAAVASSAAAGSAVGTSTLSAAGFDPSLNSQAPLPSFMRQAESARRWNRPGVRIALVGAATLLALGLMSQLLWHGREAIAAQYPGTRPALASVAQALGQELKPWQHIEALSVESSSLNPAGGGNHYRFSISLRNRSNWDVAQPWVDLSLTDAAGALVVRRMLSPTEMQAGRAALPAGADQQLQLVFDSGTQKISGYSVELFYP
ncbi:hypothetical protein CDN99_17485 [Roseateles aquatilis]|uniref:Zinc finger/thioredoxin putative domain-containing protein n=1 Tax=Roseateles aquatilis TaxID=431061 RepID=A0A246J514_9BURK|nr:zinc-ribbon and DUF3426 domain-containing protein [Roseateles aquatilis]OWQ87691.1 hypothetical protein CDN99_17485 [Roseateles aquatilis]